MEEEDKKPVFDNTFLILIGIVLVIFILIGFFPRWFIHPAASSKLDFSDTGEIGDTIGGIMGPFVAICAAILTFIAFWVQYKANKQQTKQFKIQARDARIDRFESRLSELIKIHRENLNDIKVGESQGRDAFINMLQEIKYSYYCVKATFKVQYSNEALLDIAYRVFYLGIEGKSLILLYISLQDRLSKEEIKKLIDYLYSRNNGYYAGMQIRMISDGLTYDFVLKYKPFEGHISKLGHYYRHLYHIIKFIAQQDIDFLSEKEKCEYAKTVRAQLSDYEQLILYYDVCSAFGNAWITDGYIRRFRMIKNIPLPLADFGITPDAKFADDIKYWNEKGQYFFQWDERKWIGGE